MKYMAYLSLIFLTGSVVAESVPSIANTVTRKQFNLARINDNAKVLARSLKHGHITQEEKNELLIKKTAEGKIDMVKVLLDSGADPRARNEAGTSAILEASKNGDLAIFKLLYPQFNPRSKSADSRISMNEFDEAWDTAEKNGHHNIPTYLNDLRNDWFDLTHSGW